MPGGRVAGRPGLLLLDRTLDDLTAREVWPLLAALNGDPAAPTLLVATSREEVAALFERRLVLGPEGRALERAA